ncbi:Com family DNA-binding transcriptional regulator [Ferriphaselus sp. R-1]|uniref:Com family DNA-binding transcriptional regulator n=1 Tax=Ferriphaselus sp. R-1 TaxID=1485544 RepID=UPI0009DC94BD|nr:Com family DNA-binding transcriptional regulator [Ferriphaselus sp. R-1]
METVRCGACNRKLAEAVFTRLAIKCPRCGTLNQMMATSHRPARHGASTQEETHHAGHTRPDL